MIFWNDHGLRVMGHNRFLPLLPVPLSSPRSAFAFLYYWVHCTICCTTISLSRYICKQIVIKLYARTYYHSFMRLNHRTMLSVILRCRNGDGSSGSHSSCRFRSLRVCVAVETWFPEALGGIVLLFDDLHHRIVRTGEILSFVFLPAMYFKKNAGYYVLFWCLALRECIAYVSKSE